MGGQAFHYIRFGRPPPRPLAIRRVMAYKRRAPGRRYSRFSPYGAARAVGGFAVKQAGKWAASQVKSRLMGKSANPAPITGESDWRGTYRRKPFPRRRKKRWVKFVRRVKHVIEKTTAPKFQIILKNGVIQSFSNKQTFYAGHTVLGANGNSDCDDLSRLFARALVEQSNPLTSSRSNIGIHVSGWLIETQIINLGTGTAYLDMYYWRCKRDVPSAVVSTGALFSNGLADLAGNTPPGGSTLDALDYGVTPFQSPEFSKAITVYKKVRVKLGAGSVTQIEQRSGRDYYRRWTFDENYSHLRNCTEGIFFISYGTPSATNVVADPTQLRFSTNINYTWRLLQDTVQTGGTTQA